MIDSDHINAGAPQDLTLHYSRPSDKSSLTVLVPNAQQLKPSLVARAAAEKVAVPMRMEAIESTAMTFRGSFHSQWSH